jgi:hypothetical protein
VDALELQAAGLLAGCKRKKKQGAKNKTGAQAGILAG